MKSKIALFGNRKWRYSFSKWRYNNGTTHRWLKPCLYEYVYLPVFPVYISVYICQSLPILLFPPPPYQSYSSRLHINPIPPASLVRTNPSIPPASISILLFPPPPYQSFYSSRLHSPYQSIYCPASVPIHLLPSLHTNPSISHSLYQSIYSPASVPIHLLPSLRTQSIYSPASVPIHLFSSLSQFAEENHNIPERIIWNYLVDLLMVS